MCLAAALLQPHACIGTSLLSLPQASSPVEAAALALLAAWAVSWSLGGPSRAAQTLSALQLSRLLGVALLQSALRQHLVTLSTLSKSGGSQDSSGKAAAPTSPAQRRRQAPPSPGKDINSYRLPDHSLRLKKQAAAPAAQQGSSPQQSAANSQQRWSMDAVPLSARQQVRALAKPRTSLDFDATPASPPPKGPRGGSAAAAQQLQHSRGSVADHRAAPQLAEGGSGGSGTSAGTSGSHGRRREKSFRPRMQRIASGQELAELAAGRCSSESARTSSDSGHVCQTADGAQQAIVHSSLAAAVAASAAAAAGPAALSSWLPTRLLPAWSSAGSEDGSAAADGSAPAPADPLATAELPTSPRQAAAAALDAVGRWAASTGTAAAAWTGSTLDAVLRPLIPGNGSAALASARSLLWRSPSTPQGGASAGSEAGSASGLQPAPSAPLPTRRPAHGSAGADRRRQSVDGVSPRHYTHGGVTADPNRLQALENLAAAARLQLCASRSRLGPPTPGHAAVAAGGAGCAGAPLGADAGASALASVGLDGDCPQVRQTMGRFVGSMGGSCCCCCFCCCAGCVRPSPHPTPSPPDPHALFLSATLPLPHRTFGSM